MPVVELDRIFTRLIARQFGVEEGDITASFLRRKRKKSICRNAHYGIGLNHGLFGDGKSIFLTRNQLEEISGIVDEFLVCIQRLEVYESAI